MPATMKILRKISQSPRLSILAAATGLMVVIIGVIALTTHQHMGLADMLHGSRKHAISPVTNSAAKISATPSPSATATPSASTAPASSSGPVATNGHIYGASTAIAGEYSSYNPSTKPLIVSAGEVTTLINKNSPAFTVTSPDPTGICLPSSDYNPNTGLTIAGTTTYYCAMEQTVMIVGAKTVGTYDFHFYANSTSKVNGKYLKYDGYITVHVLPHPNFTLSTSNVLLSGSDFYVTVTTDLDPGYADGYVPVQYVPNAGTPQCKDTVYTPVSDTVLNFKCTLGQGIVFNTPNILKFSGYNGYFTRETTAQFTLTSP